MNIAIWHCYWYGPRDTYVMLAETNELLEAKVREAIADGWYPEDDGPMPERLRRPDGEVSRGQRGHLLLRRLGLHCHRQRPMHTRGGRAMSALHRRVWEGRLEDLCDEYDAWCLHQRLPPVDAEEQLCGRVTAEQREWLQDFCKRWENTYD
jgi:hypothetical protein